MEIMLGAAVLVMAGILFIRRRGVRQQRSQPATGPKRQAWPVDDEPADYLSAETANQIMNHAGTAEYRFLLAAFKRSLEAEGYTLTRKASEQTMLDTDALKSLALRLAAERTDALPWQEKQLRSHTTPFCEAGPVGQVVWLINGSAAVGWYITTAAEKSASLQI